jgi:hypothetical protein
MLRRSIVIDRNFYCTGLNVATTAYLIQQSWAPMLGLLARCTIAVVLVILFRPLIMGMLRAALLMVRPRLSREQRQARAHQRDRRVLERMIASSSGPSHTAELRAIAARA